MDKQMYLHTMENKGHKKKWSAEICYNIDETWTHYLKGKKLDTRDHICLITIYMKGSG
jgi:hypothetical protein